MSIKAINFPVDEDIAIDIGPPDFRVFRLMANRIEFNDGQEIVVTGTNGTNNYSNLLNILGLHISKCFMSANESISFRFSWSTIEITVQPDKTWGESWRFCCTLRQLIYRYEFRWERIRHLLWGMLKANHFSLSEQATNQEYSIQQV